MFRAVGGEPGTSGSRFGAPSGLPVELDRAVGQPTLLVLGDLGPAPVLFLVRREGEGAFEGGICDHPNTFSRHRDRLWRCLHVSAEP